MDIFAHALWAGAIFGIINLKRNKKNKLKTWQAVLWGIFPDVFTFAIPFTIIIYSLIFASTNIGQGFAQGLFSPSSPLFLFTHNLYLMSHSLVTFLIIFFISYLIFRKPIWVMLGWLLHILIDIPSHSGEWATHFIWPISNISFQGIAWWTHWQVVAINYFLLLIVYIYLFYKKRK